MPEPAAFDALAREFFAVWFRFHPEAALALGLGDYGNLLPPQSDDEHAALASWLEALIVALEELDHGALDPARRLDAELMFALARVEHRELLERDWRRRNPLRFLPLTTIHRLTLLAPASLRDDLLALLRAVPAHLRLALTQLMPMAELIPPPLVAAAIHAAEAGPVYLRELVRSRWLRAHCHGTGEIETAAEAAAAALSQYAAALRHDLAPRAAGPCGAGAEQLGFLLRHRHRLDIAPADCAPLLARLADAVAAAEAPAEAAPPADGVGAECARQQAMLRARGLFTLPAAALGVAGGPACPRPGAASAAGQAVPAEPGGLDYVPDLTRGRGTLYVADGSGGCRLAPAAEQLRCLRLGWGGLHTLTFGGGMAARSLPRLLAGGGSLARGWPLALEALLAEAPAALDAGSVRQARQAAVALARLDLDLHAGRLPIDAARERAAALGEPDCVLAALIRRPGDAVAAVLGWRLIHAARGRVLKTDGAQGLRGFHDRLLAQGPVPATAALAAALGADAVRELTAALCTGA